MGSSLLASSGDAREGSGSDCLMDFSRLVLARPQAVFCRGRVFCFWLLERFSSRLLRGGDLKDWSWCAGQAGVRIAGCCLYDLKRVRADRGRLSRGKNYLMRHASCGVGQLLSRKVAVMQAGDQCIASDRSPRAGERIEVRADTKAIDDHFRSGEHDQKFDWGVMCR